MNENIKKFEELLKDEALAKELLAIEQPEDAQKWLSDHGVELSLDEVREIGLLVNGLVSGEISEADLKVAAEGELSEDDLENVAGGVKWTTSDTVAIAASAVFAIVVGGLQVVADIGLSW